MVNLTSCIFWIGMNGWMTYKFEFIVYTAILVVLIEIQNISIEICMYEGFKILDIDNA